MDHRARRRLRASGSLVAARRGTGTGAGHPHAQSGGLEPLRLLRHLRRERLLLRPRRRRPRPRATTARNRAACPPWSWTANTTTRAPAQRRHARHPPPCTAAPSAWGRACPCWWCRPGAGAAGSTQVFDHTSVIRFLEARHGVMEPNISAWRRAVAGDLTSALDFSGERDRGRAARRPSRRAATAPCPMRWKPWAA